MYIHENVKFVLFGVHGNFVKFGKFVNTLPILYISVNICHGSCLCMSQTYYQTYLTWQNAMVVHIFNTTLQNFQVEIIVFLGESFSNLTQPSLT